MSPELVLSIISVGIAIADFAYSIYESSHTSSKSTNTTSVNIRIGDDHNTFVLINPTNQPQKIPFFSLERSGPSFLGWGILIAIFLIGWFLRQYYYIFVILLSISTAVFLIEAIKLSNNIYVPLKGKRRLLWFASPGIILICSILINVILGQTSYPEYFGIFVEMIFSIFIYSILAFSFLFLFVLHFFSLLIPHVHNNNKVTILIISSGLNLFKLWWFPAFCAALSVVILLLSPLAMSPTI